MVKQSAVLLVVLVMSGLMSGMAMPPKMARFAQRSMAQALRALCDFDQDGILGTSEEQQCFRKHNSFFSLG
ncbi:hypothetical protein MAR_024288 [Mya arenaria]|uniref:EF-hand domain-containing protein n=1 Tax=Mya arenaria TaxID=6604 RepID=A0ABY7DTB4_MYAAR|nr:hypothetical protein MAR_024288 [Mya arenaria]